MQSKMIFLVTGGTGLVGHGIISSLLQRSAEMKQEIQVRALVRSIEKAHKLIPPTVELVVGDVTDEASLEAAVSGCTSVFHAAGMPEHWTKDESVFEAVNVQGTQNVLNAMVKHKVPRMIYTSTMDALEFKDGEPYDESQLALTPLPSAYQRSKLKATQLVVRAAEEKQVAVVVVHPSAVFGPGPMVTPTMNDFLMRLANNEIPMLLPSGYPINYSVDDGQLHVLAEEALREGRIQSPSRYLCSDRYFTLSEIAELVRIFVPKAKVPSVLPMWVASMVSSVGNFFSGFTGKAPLIPPSILAGLKHQGRPNSRKAQDELGWKITPANEAIRLTLEFLEREGKLKNPLAPVAAAAK